MKIGVISDVHSNVLAFRACLEYMEREGCEEYLFLGDYISDTPYARETMDLLYEFTASHKCMLLRGNREEYMLNQRKARREGLSDQIWRYNSASGSLLYTYELLTDADLDFFDSLPICFKYEKEGLPAIRCCHGSPGNSRELLQFGSDELKHWLGEISEDYLLCAHTHIPGRYDIEGKHYFNSGCVGIAFGDVGVAQCMILRDKEDDGRVIWEPEFLKIPFDYKKVVSDIKTSGLLDKAPWFINSNIQVFLTGVDHSAEMVHLALELSQEDKDGKEWPLTDDKFFAEAAAKLGIPDYRE